MRYFLLIFLSAVVFSCTNKDDLPEGVLKPEKMQAVFWDFIRADVYTTEFLKNDSTKNAKVENLKLQDKLFKLHNTTREQFYKSYTWYSNHKELMTTMLDTMIARKEREKSTIKSITKPVSKPL